MTDPAIPDHMRRALDALGVRTPPNAPRQPAPPADNGWYRRGEECPF